ncbi:hypothetical protein ASC00_24980 [Salmonella enterica subsp. enterica serovar Enteritidis]|nr:hypothetical protein [Salmonella enterica subsp. enterica serovar Enteritidis]ECX0098895.1 hypothetical protein [Salmonella enterica subsp. enterica serovar Enteritidis]EEA4796628.1 hypothetical protein [Salmonella enterica]EEJ3458444.1 hypothetical protein [Salmonella enterica subsp. enterica]
MTAKNIRRPSPLQRRVLIVLAALDAKNPGPVPTRNIERVLEMSGEAPVYGPNLRASCRRMEAAGWLRTLRASNLQLAVELTSAGREVATPLLVAEQERQQAEQRSAAVMVLPLVRKAPSIDINTRVGDLLVQLDNVWYMSCRCDYVIRLDGTTCLQLWNSAGHLTRLSGDPLQVATWLQTCHDAGIDIRMQINESTTPDEGMTAGVAPVDQTDAWYSQLEASLLAIGITGLTDNIRQSVVMPGETTDCLPPPARLLHELRESPEAFPLSASSYEDDTSTALADLLSRSGFTAAQTRELQLHRTRWPLMNEEEFERRLNSSQDNREE